MTEEYRTIWNTLELDETIRIDETIPSESVDDWRDTLRNSLPHLPLGKTGEAHFEVAQIIGRGGMGIVHEARQRALARNVAIKRIPDDKVSREAENALLLEARVMGIVEHPNVVPVHIIGQDDSGRPVIVMKRIDGTPWEDFINGRADIPDDDPLGFHLDVAKAVCRALSFAHDRGLIHRDIKPENVMVGRFGEVYLLDWGLAVALDENEAQIPLAADADQVVGTPAFMAPEMTVGEGHRLGTATDVFLLGATLFCAIAKKPPHEGESLFAVMSAAYLGRRVDYPDGIPLELRDICERAMALEPSERFESVDDFREAIDDFLSHRASHLLVEDARSRLAALRVAIEGEDEDAIHQIFGEARFGFASAQRIWSENEDARQGLRDTLVAMIRWELDEENVAAARALYGQLDAPHPHVREAIERLAEEIEKREAKLEKIAFDYDEDVGVTERRRFIGVTGTLLVLLPVLKWIWVDDWVVPEPLAQLTTDPVLLVISFSGVTFVPIAIGLIWVTAKYYRDHKVSRIFSAGLVVMFIFGMFVRSRALFGGIALHQVLAMELAIYATGLFCLGLAIDRRLGRAGFVVTFAIFPVYLLPAYATEFFSVGLGLSAISFALFSKGRWTLPWAEDARPAP